MKKKQSYVRPTDGELEILRILWQFGPSGVGQVHKVHRVVKPITYNTTLKLMLIMHGKGLLTRDESVRPQIYEASVPENELQQRLVWDLLQRAFGGSARKLVAALTATNLSVAERQDIRQLLKEMEDEQ
ncbi:MAG: BlaI/MecI/CopY family transcriptional regulator [Phycisphaerales bacterium]|nr:BlaI/MecI/CopY family transcriptional regulator [Phycisphaerales bacterium]